MPLISALLGDGAIGRRRAEVLERLEWFPEGDLRSVDIELADVMHDPGQLAGCVAAKGVGVFRLCRPLTVREFIGLAEQFGRPERESDSSLGHRVEQRVVLNLVPDARGPVTEQNQPFSTSSLTLHIEGSRRPRGTAPSFLLFQCLTPSPRDEGSQTILRSVDGLLADLSDEALGVLATTILGPRQTDAPIVYEHDFQRRLNFRDPWPQPYDLASDSDEKTALQAVTELLKAIYDSKSIIGIPWERNTLAVVDNRRWLHGRTRGNPGARHLQRIRIGSLDSERVAR